MYHLSVSVNGDNVDTVFMTVYAMKISYARVNSGIRWVVVSRHRDSYFKQGNRWICFKGRPR
jgi:hypothetical protein